jgi:peptidoglycan/LPS O-acetylase OafA/YrhL
MRIAPLTRDDTALYKGIGILLIVLHNFLHNVPPLIGENEFTYDAEVTARFAAAMTMPEEWGRALFTYLGHYGVQLFIFLSAYGLARRYAQGPPRLGPFLRSRLDKVYLPFLGVVILYSLLWPVRGWLLGDPEPLAWRSVLLSLTLVSNVVPGEAMKPVGPWWFMPFIFQFYLVFPLLWRLALRRGAAALLWVAAGSLALEWAVNPALVATGVNLNHTVVGHLPLLCLGLYVAMRQEVRVGPLALAALAALFVGANLHGTVWLLGDVAAGVLLLAAAYPLVRRPHRANARAERATPESPLRDKANAGGPVRRVLVFYGTISMPLFLVNGFLRSPFAVPAEAVNLWWFTLLCALGSLLFSTAVAFALHEIELRWRARRAARRRGAAGAAAVAAAAAQAEREKAATLP